MKSFKKFLKSDSNDSKFFELNEYIMILIDLWVNMYICKLNEYIMILIDLWVNMYICMCMHLAYMCVNYDLFINIYVYYVLL